MPKPILIACAMKEEAEPFLGALPRTGGVSTGEVSTVSPQVPHGFRGPTDFHTGTLMGMPVVVAVTGIGMTNAALAMTLALSQMTPRAVVFAGTTGGLGQNVHLGDVIVANSAIYHDADASDFGYTPGQIPQMPAVYEADAPLVAASESSLRAAGISFHAGQVSSSNSFVSGAQVEPVRQRFPDVLGVDMETSAGAQVCWSFHVPWVSLRAVSDLCDPNAGEVFDASAPPAYQRSFEATLALISALA